MSTMPYDPYALAKFVESTDHFGLQRVPPPPKTIVEGDMVRREPNAVIQWFGAIFVFFVSSLASGLIFVAAMAVKMGPEALKDPSFGIEIAEIAAPAGNDPMWTIIALATNALVATVLYWIWVRLSTKRPVYELTGEGWLKEFGVGLLLGTLMICAIIGTLFTMGYYKVDGVQFTPGILVGLFIGIGPAFAEEMIFRGFALRLLSKATGSWIALLITSLVFGLIHAGNPYVTWLQALLLGLSAGILLGAAYFVTRRLWLAIGIHLSWNFVQGGIFNSDVSGTGYTGGLVKGTFTGPEWWTGGKMGIEGSVLSIGVTLAVALVFLIIAFRRGHMNPRVGWNAPRLDLNGRIPRIQIWSADGYWRVLPTPEELDELMHPVEEEDTPYLPDHPHLVDDQPTNQIVPDPIPTPDPVLMDLDSPDADGDPFGNEATLSSPQAMDMGDRPATSPDEGAAPGDEDTLIEPAQAEEAIAEQTQVTDLAPLPPVTPLDDVLEGQETPASPGLTGVKAPVVTDPSTALGETGLDQTQPIPFIAPPSDKPTITKVSSAVTTVTGTGMGHVTDEDLDATQRMDVLDLDGPAADPFAADDDPFGPEEQSR